MRQRSFCKETMNSKWRRSLTRWHLSNSRKRSIIHVTTTWVFSTCLASFCTTNAGTHKQNRANRCPTEKWWSRKRSLASTRIIQSCSSSLCSSQPLYLFTSTRICLTFMTAWRILPTAGKSILLLMLEELRLNTSLEIYSLFKKLSSLALLLRAWL